MNNPLHFRVIVVRRYYKIARLKLQKMFYFVATFSSCKKIYIEKCTKTRHQYSIIINIRNKFEITRRISDRTYHIFFSIEINFFKLHNFYLFSRA